MVHSRKLILAALSIALLAGCADMKRLTGQIDDTRLPGQRSDILPADQQQVPDPTLANQPGAIQQDGIYPAPGTKTGLPVAAPQDQATIAACNPKVDLCPQAPKVDSAPPAVGGKPVAKPGSTVATTGATPKAPDKLSDGKVLVDATKQTDAKADAKAKAKAKADAKKKAKKKPAPKAKADDAPAPPDSMVAPPPPPTPKSP